MNFKLCIVAIVGLNVLLPCTRCSSLHAKPSWAETDIDGEALETSDSISATADQTTCNPFPPDIPSAGGNQWKRVGYLDMTDPTQSCYPAWKESVAERRTCNKRTEGPSCDSAVIRASNYNYKTVCGRFRGYQVSSTDAFCFRPGRVTHINGPYVDGLSITYGSANNRKHLFTYASGVTEKQVGQECNCPCSGGTSPPAFIGSDYYCESGNPTANVIFNKFFYDDPLWDGRQCSVNEAGCCNKPNMPWFCKTLPTAISENIEVRICTDQSLLDEDFALEYFELFVK
eukprot:Em0007g490a